MLILLLLIGGFWFLEYRTADKTETLDYGGNHYYATAYIRPNLSYKGKETTIFGGATYVGHYKNKKLNKSLKLNIESNLWKIHDISSKKLLVEMTSKNSEMVWGNKNFKTPKEALIF